MRACNVVLWDSLDRTCKHPPPVQFLLTFLQAQWPQAVVNKDRPQRANFSLSFNSKRPSSSLSCVVTRQMQGSLAPVVQFLC